MILLLIAIVILWGASEYLRAPTTDHACPTTEKAIRCPICR